MGTIALSRARMTTKLYRAVSEAEFQDIVSSGQFRLVPGSLEGKWFAEHPDAAREWGRRFARSSGIPHDRIVEAEVDAAVANQFFRRPMLDDIGPARFAEIEQLRGAVIREFTG